MDALQVLKVLAQVGCSRSETFQILDISERAGSALQGKAYKGAGFLSIKLTSSQAPKSWL